MELESQMKSEEKGKYLKEKKRAKNVPQLMKNCDSLNRNSQNKEGNVGKQLEKTEWAYFL